MCWFITGGKICLANSTNEGAILTEDFLSMKALFFTKFYDTKWYQHSILSSKKKEKRSIEYVGFDFELIGATCRVILIVLCGLRSDAKYHFELV